MTMTLGRITVRKKWIILALFILQRKNTLNQQQEKQTWSRIFHDLGVGRGRSQRVVPLGGCRYARPAGAANGGPVEKKGQYFSDHQNVGKVKFSFQIIAFKYLFKPCCAAGSAGGAGAGRRMTGPGRAAGGTGPPTGRAPPTAGGATPAMGITSAGRGPTAAAGSCGAGRGAPGPPTTAAAGSGGAGRGAPGRAGTGGAGRGTPGIAAALAGGAGPAAIGIEGRRSYIWSWKFDAKIFALWMTLEINKWHWKSINLIYS